MSALILRRYYHITLIGLIIIAGTSGFIFLMRPALEDFRLARNQEKETAGRLAAANTRLEQVHELAAQITRGTPAEIEKLKALFIVIPELAYLSTILESHGQSAHFLMTSLTVGTGARVLTQSAAMSEGPTKAATSLVIQAQFKGGGYPELK